MLLTITASLFLQSAQADEGMWLPEQLPERAAFLSEMGLEMDPGELSTVDGALAAIASLGHCTAAFVSQDGLLATNAHCTRSYLQHASQSVDRDLVQEGFYAAARSEELSAGPKAKVFLVEGMSDVTERVLKGSKKRRLKDAERFRLVDRARKEITAECEAAAESRRCKVVSFDGGMRYQLVIEKEINDVRLVFVPSEAIAMFGGDTDNWMWPRHCGDFAFVRAYVGPDGQSAAYAEENVPLQTPAYLQMTGAGVAEGDFVWIAGFPASTFRTRSAPEGIHAATNRYPDGISMFTDLMKVLRRHARKNKEARIKLNNAMFGLSNRRKSYQGMLANFESSGFTDSKAEERRDLENWIEGDRARQKRFQRDVDAFHLAVEEQMAVAQRDRLVRLTGWAPRHLRTARTAYRWSIEQEKTDLDRRVGYQERDRERIETDFKTMERSYFAPADRGLAKKIFGWILELEGEQAVGTLPEWFEEHGGLDAALETLYDAPALAQKSARLDLLQQSKSQLETSEDPWIQLAIELEQWLEGQKADEESRKGAMIRLRPRFVEALKIMKGDDFYSDANGTLRLSFGHVAGYAPQEAVSYAPTTSLAGLLAKGGDGEFTVDSDLARVASSLPEGAAAQVPVNFLSTLDNTGGNSGSPTLNAKGEMVGWVFDRNWEAVAADWVFAPDLTRTIHVDARYALWLLREVFAAEALLTELGIPLQAD
jgi:hypothetical protein